MADRQVARRWELPMDRLLDPAGQVDRLVIWQAGSVSESDWAAIRQWVEQGHVALIGGALDQLPSPFTQGSQGKAFSAAVHPATVGIRAISVGPDRFTIHDPERITLVQDDAGQPVVHSWPLGSGRIYWSADAEWLTNARIEQAQNLEFALSLLTPSPGKQVAFDEYHHGFQAASKWWQILRGPLQWFLILLALAVALLFWSYGVQFGAPRPTPAGPPRAAVEYVYSMSQLYRRAQARQIVLQSLYHSLVRELGRLLGGRRGLSHEEIARLTAHRAGTDPASLANLLNRLSPNQTSPPSESELIKLARETEAVQRRMQHAGFRDQRDPLKGTK